MPDPIEVDGFGTLNQGLVHDVVVLQEGGGGGGTFNEAALVSVAGSLSQTLKFNYERLNQIGHPNPSPWPHGAATVEWVKRTALQARNVTIGVAGQSQTLSRVAPWQGCAAIDISGDVSAFLLPTNAQVGDIVDVVVARGGPCAALDAGGDGTITDYGQIYVIGSNQGARLLCTNSSGPVWSVSGLSMDQWDAAVNSSAVAEGLANSLGHLYLNYQPLNELGDPNPEWPHGAVPAGHANAHFLHTRNVLHVLDNTDQALTQAVWQAVIVRSRIGGWPNTVLPITPILGDVVLWKVNQGADNSKISPPSGGNLSVGIDQYFNRGGPFIAKLVCTDATPDANVWSLTEITEEQFQDECTSQAVGLALESGGLASQVVSAVSSARTIIWRPNNDPGSGYLTNWADVVAAVNLVSGPTTIQIEVDNPESDMITIPGGTWVLNETTIVGMVTDALSDTSYRGRQIQLYLVTAGDPSNPTWIKGCVGLKNISWRATNWNSHPVNGSAGTVLSKSGDTVTFTHTDSYAFGAKDIGKPIRIGTISPYSTFGSDVGTAGNRGTFTISNVLNANTIQYSNSSAEVATPRTLRVTVDLPAAGDPVSLTVDVTLYSYTVLNGDDAAAAAQGFVDAVNAGGGDATFTASRDGSDVVLTAKVAGTAANGVAVGPPATGFINPVDTSGVDGDVHNGIIGWSLCTSVFITEDSAGTDCSFVLDNVDFRFGGDYNWGSFYVSSNGALFLRLTNSASIRWFSLIVDGYLIVQSDGGGSWVGSLAFCGQGSVDVFPMPGTQVRTWQSAISSWTLHEPYTVYLPANTGYWSGTPASVHEALDNLAQTRLLTGNNLSDLGNPATARGNLGLGTAFTRLAPTEPVALGTANATTNPAIAIDTAGCSPGTVTLIISDGAFDGQEISLFAGPWGADVFWDVTADGGHSAFQSGSTLHFTGLAGSVTLKWWAYNNSWFIKSMFGLVSVTA